jgi:magnesium-transporting ATPase (P-type)
MEVVMKFFGGLVLLLWSAAAAATDVILLTGDVEAVASAVGRQLAIDEVEAGLLPTGKLARIDALLAERRSVAMVGDGINDAPALMRASVGVAPARTWPARARRWCCSGTTCAPLPRPCASRGGAAGSS